MNFNKDNPSSCKFSDEGIAAIKQIVRDEIENYDIDQRIRELQNAKFESIMRINQFHAQMAQYGETGESFTKGFDQTHQKLLEDYDNRISELRSKKHL